MALSICIYHRYKQRVRNGARSLLEKRIEDLEIELVKQDVIRFIRNSNNNYPIKIS
jgi:hypothetical protein